MSRLPTSGALSWNDIQNSFGGSNPIAINEYYNGGSLVPNSSLNTNIPTSGAINANNFYGGDGFNGTTGNFTIGNSGGKVPSYGVRQDSTGTYGTDKGLAFTTGQGIKVCLVNIYWNAVVIIMNTVHVANHGVTTTNLRGRVVTIGSETSTIDNSSGATSTISGGPYNGFTQNTWVFSVHGYTILPAPTGDRTISIS